VRLIFMGTPGFAVPALAALVAAGHAVAAVYTRPPRPAGRGQRERRSAVHDWAESRGLAVRAPARLRDPAEHAAFAALGADAAVVAAYGLILPKPVLDAPRQGCLNIHASLLPRWRGAAPIQRAILAGDAETGVTIMRMDEGLDTGPMLLAEATPIGPADTAGTLTDRLAAIGARLMVEALARLARGALAETSQPETGIALAPKIGKDEARLDWSRPAAALERAVRAFDPSPGAFAALGGERLKVLAAAVEAGQGEAGTTLDDRLLVACGEGALRLARVQPAGGKAMDAAAFLRGRPVPAGTRLS
jgi:methionyl-tRNA formyltransferase